MIEFLKQHVAIVEILFAIGLVFALIYAIQQKDMVTIGTIVGGILGYLKGYSNGSATTAVSTSSEPIVGKEAGFTRLGVILPLAFVCLALVSLLSAGCAGQSAQVTTGKTLLTMHDLGKTGAETANTLCVQKVIQPADCMKIKTAYDLFHRAWPLVDDALIVYLKSSKDDVTAMQTFQMAQSAFIKDYADLLSVLTVSGVIKEVK